MDYCCSEEKMDRHRLRHHCHRYDSYQNLLQEKRRRPRRWIRHNIPSSSSSRSRKLPSSSIVESYIPGVFLFVAYLVASISFTTVFMDDPSAVTAFLDLVPPSFHRHHSSIRTVPSQIYQQPPLNSSPSFSEEDQDDDDHENDDDGRTLTMTHVSSSSSSSSSSSIEQQELKSLKEQAAQLRREAEALQVAVQQSKLEKKRAEQEKVDGWIEELLIEARFGCEIVDDDSEDDGSGSGRENGRDDNVSTKSKTSSSSSAISRSSSSSTTQTETELLKDVDQVLERLRDDRYSAEQINKIFRRLCEIRPQESRSNISPMMELLVDAACKLDCQERDENPNKRWNHGVERWLRKKLFARDWNIELRDEDEIDAENPWKV